MSLPSLVGNDPATQKAVNAIREALAQVRPEASFPEQESLAMDIANEGVRLFIQDKLQAIAEELRGDVECNGKLYREHEEGTVTYHSLCGPVSITRPTARLAEVRNGPTIVPLEIAAGLAERTTPALAYALVHGYATEGSREVFERLGVARRVPPARATIERVSGRLAAFAAEHLDSTLRGVRRAERLPEGTAGLSIGIDRASTPMRELVPEGESRPEPKRAKPRVRRAPLPYDVVFRMSYVVTVSYLDEDGQTLAARRYAAPASDEPDQLVDQAMLDVTAACAKRPGLTVGLVQDGAPEMWNLGRRGLEPLAEQGIIDGWFEAVDRCHLMGRLGKALDILALDPTEREPRLDEWAEQLDNDDGAIDAIENWLETQARKAPRPQQTALEEHLTYLQNNKDRMRYVTMRECGLPVGSGVTESAAKTVINARTKRSGQRWTPKGLRGVLALRGLLQSARLPAFWTSLSRRFVANITCAACA
jgi:hypothetical protein